MKGQSDIIVVVVFLLSLIVFVVAMDNFYKIQEANREIGNMFIESISESIMEDFKEQPKTLPFHAELVNRSSEGKMFWRIANWSEWEESRLLTMTSPPFKIQIGLEVCEEVECDCYERGCMAICFECEGGGI